jgi:hypothetical protein
MYPGRFPTETPLIPLFRFSELALFIKVPMFSTRSRIPSSPRSGRICGRSGWRPISRRRSAPSTSSREEVWRQVLRSCRVPDQGPRRPAGLLQLPRRALGSRVDNQSHRKPVRHGPPPDGPDQRRALPGHRQAHDLQAHLRGSQNLAKTEGQKPVAQSHPGRQFRDGIEVSVPTSNSAA